MVFYWISACAGTTNLLGERRRAVIRFFCKGRHTEVSEESLNA